MHAFGLRLTSGSSHSSLVSGTVDPTATVDDITWLMVKAIEERRRTRAKPPAFPSADDQAMFEMVMRGIYWKTAMSTEVEILTGCKVTVVESATTPVVAPAAEVDSPTTNGGKAVAVEESVAPGIVTPGSLVLSRRRPGAGEGLWVLDLALFRESYP